ncbi:unnamed protein product, partial [Closterium sp. NIES-54]
SPPTSHPRDCGVRRVRHARRRAATCGASISTRRTGGQRCDRKGCRRRGGGRMGGRGGKAWRVRGKRGQRKEEEGNVDGSVVCDSSGAPAQPWAEPNSTGSGLCGNFFSCLQAT